MPDPISNDIRELQKDNIRLQKKVKELEKHMRCVRDNSIEIRPDEAGEDKEEKS